ncbi:hypothetical protein BACCAP_03983 [Pseudoflavonifractor capillosus ATCC 29799]|uniref:Uncharacterized protein n=1 Tax=Pseudoflavonifractor capillosus ATCC 29799 TaxID=411467 RepID=A6P0H2_9FIRM|nr:hypothetical protein BACCAP_03983 [Pseudoflavonifractor capillosus ATCC 29799]
MFLQTLSRCWGNFSATLFIIFILSYQGTRFLYKGIIINHNKNRASLH